MKSPFLLGIALLCATFGLWIVMAQPMMTPLGPSEQSRVSPQALKDHIELLMALKREAGHPADLDSAAGYIFGKLAECGGRVSDQLYDASAVVPGYTRARNLIASFGPSSGERIIVGAHYDSFGGFPGADDNASGVAGLLELARLLQKDPPGVRVDLVAFAAEEPPLFGTPLMGSAVYARSVEAERGSVLAVIVLESIGYFKNDLNSQTYPTPLLRLFYPTEANFIAIVGGLRDRELAKIIKKGMLFSTNLPAASINAPVQINGIDGSDHRSFWPLGIPAVMVTDTALYRNPNYHTANDRAETLDYERMAKAVAGVWAALGLLATR